MYGAGRLVVTINLAGSAGSGVPNVPWSRAIPGYILLSAEFIGKLKIVPCGAPSCTAISGAGVWVGPMTKFPLASAGGTVPSGSSFFATKPGVFGSRVGGVGRGG